MNNPNERPKEMWALYVCENYHSHEDIFGEDDEPNLSSEGWSRLSFPTFDNERDAFTASTAVNHVFELIDKDVGGGSVAVKLDENNEPIKSSISEGSVGERFYSAP